MLVRKLKTKQDALKKMKSYENLYCLLQHQLKKKANKGRRLATRYGHWQPRRAPLCFRVSPPSPSLSLFPPSFSFLFNQHTSARQFPLGTDWGRSFTSTQQFAYYERYGSKYMTASNPVEGRIPPHAEGLGQKWSPQPLGTSALLRRESCDAQSA